jgi:hypothetical protein
MIVRVKTLNNHLRCRQALKSQPGASLAACKLAFVRSSLAGALILSSTSRGCYFVRQSVFGNPSAMLQEALNTYIRKPNAHEPALFMSTKNTAQLRWIAAAVRTTQPQPNFCSLKTQFPRHSWQVSANLQRVGCFSRHRNERTPQQLADSVMSPAKSDIYVGA